jgi:hypothetical protein
MLCSNAFLVNVICNKDFMDLSLYVIKVIVLASPVSPTDESEFRNLLIFILKEGL